MKKTQKKKKNLHKEKTVRIKDTLHPLLAKADRRRRITSGKKPVVLEKPELSDKDVFQMLLSHM